MGFGPFPVGLVRAVVGVLGIIFLVVVSRQSLEEAFSEVHDKERGPQVEDPLEKARAFLKTTCGGPHVRVPCLDHRW